MSEPVALAWSLFGSPTVNARLGPLGGRLGSGTRLTSRGSNRVDFEVPESHVYLAATDRPNFREAPTVTTWQPEAPGGYELRGEVSLRGTGRAALYLLQFGGSEPLAKHSTHLRHGPFRLRFQVQSECTSLVLAVRLAGSGSLEWSELSYGPNKGLSFVEELRQLDGERARTRLFLAGCPRSGTTLLLNMMRCFADTWVDLSERDFRHFALIADPARTHVLKRTGHCWETLAEIPPEVDVIYLVRHPYDVLTSRHQGDLGKGYFTTVGEWENEYRALLQLEELRQDHGLCLLRYEDLVSDADGVQERIGEWLGPRASEVRIPFSRFHELAREDESLYQLALSGVRPPDQASIHKWRRDRALKRDLEAILRTPPQGLQEFMARFGYD